VTAALPAVRSAHPWLADCEFRFLPFRNLTILPRQRRANQAAVHRTLVFRRSGLVLAAHVLGRLISLERLQIERLCQIRVISVALPLLVDERLLVGGTEPARLRRVNGAILRAPAALRGNPGSFVFVVGIAGRAAGLLHLVVDHRYNGVVGDAALTRTVVVQNVTEPKPALLH
jgi:hypothetical protein